MAVDALKIVSSLSRPFIVAGTPFTITTTVQNAHDDKVEILEYIYHVPYQAQWILDAEFCKAYTEIEKRNPLARLFSRTALRRAAQPPGEDMVLKNLKEPGSSIQTVLPGESVSYSFKVLVPKWLLATGSQINFEGCIKYKYKDEIHTSPFNAGFALRPPLQSNIIGAVIGGILGTTAKLLKEYDPNTALPIFDVSFLSASGLAVILGIVMVVFSSRRTADIQPILTIEDIWGGIIAGFLVGYLGHDFFGEVVPIGKS
ncbi:MAG: hypothetical protein JSU69_05085 [Candidatus Zixiibacteriota bacterium]|nr:MAG: hypothetical protein JSU69_05085 [candidate division Zixibacteria bacterium]